MTDTEKPITPAQFMEQFNLTKAQLIEQYKQNLEGLKAMHTKASKTGKKVNGYTITQLNELIGRYTKLANLTIITESHIITAQQAIAIAEHFKQAQVDKDGNGNYWNATDFEGKTIFEAAKMLDCQPKYVNEYITGMIGLLNSAVH